MTKSKAKPKNKKKSSDVVRSQKAPKPVGAYVHARKVGNLLFLAGMGPRSRQMTEIPGVNLDAMGRVLSYDIEIQTEAVIANVKTVLQEAGSSLDKVVDVQVFLTNMQKDFPIFNHIYEKHFKSIPATRTTVEVRALPTPIAVEFKVIAVV